MSSERSRCARGLTLLWVCWKMWRELRTSHTHHQNAEEALADQDFDKDGMISGPPTKTLGQATWQIVVADVSMSLDNVLAVAGAAREHPMILIFGLALSIALIGLAASFIAQLLQKQRWIAYVGHHGGTDDIPYTDAQYDQLARVVRGLLATYPMLSPTHITGHSDIAPGRKTDPGPAFEWSRFRSLIA